MDDVPSRLARWWGGLEDSARRDVSILALICAGFVGHYLVFTIPQPFFIEDSGISFAFARNFVEGDGFVGYPGGERVEGYSNFTWTMLIAALYALGVPPWTSAKVVGAVLGTATLPLVYRIVRKADPSKYSRAALLAPALLAASTQYVVWAASGLENSLVCFLLAGGIHQLLVDMDEDSPKMLPRSAFWFAALAMSRPETVAYGGIAGLALVLDATVRRRFALLARWIPCFLLPIVAYQGWRYWYFAWEFPNTYYAKLGTGKKFKPWTWDAGGWKYIKNYMVNHHVIYVLPLFTVATAGIRTTMRWLAVGVVVVVGIPLFWDGKAGLEHLGLDPAPAFWSALVAKWGYIRTYLVAGAVTVLGLAVLLRPGWRARGMLWCVTVFGTFFALYTGGDWMDQFRWFNMVVMGMLPMLALAVVELVHSLVGEQTRIRVPASWVGAPEWVQRGFSVRKALILAALGLWVAGEAYESNRFANEPETSVRDIFRRVRYMSWVQRKLDVDNVTLLDVDMGAHMYYSGWRIVDIAGLIDVPMARHSNFDMKFIRNYVFEERNPEFAHVHGGWATTSKIPRHKEWKERYIEIAGYPISKRVLHIGNYVRRDLIASRSVESFDSTAVGFEGMVTMTKFSLPSPVVAPGGFLFLDTEWAATLRRHDFRIVVFLHDETGVVAANTFAPGHGWFPSNEWKVSDRVRGPYRLRIPEALPEGTYRVGLVLLDEASGEVLPFKAGDKSAEAVFLPGEWHASATVQVVSKDAALDEANRVFAGVGPTAEAGDCEGAWQVWKNAGRHVLNRPAWLAEQEQLARRSVGSCHALRADAETELSAKASHLKTALLVDHRNPDARARAGEVADAAEEIAEARWAEEDWEQAYRMLSMSLDVDPSRSWTRRKAEDARDYWLRVVRPGRTKADLPSRALPEGDTLDAGPSEEGVEDVEPFEGGER